MFHIENYKELFVINKRIKTLISLSMRKPAQINLLLSVNVRVTRWYGLFFPYSFYVRYISKSHVCTTLFLNSFKLTFQFLLFSSCIM